MVHGHGERRSLRLRLKVQTLGYHLVVRRRGYFRTVGESRRPKSKARVWQLYFREHHEDFE